MEKYSVLMSLYIKEKPEYLKQSIQSMIEQTLKPDEIVIVKDGPITQELQAVLDEYKGEYPKLFHIVGYETNRGLGKALNYGLKRCRNELVARMDTDDISRHERCEQQAKYLLMHSSADIVGGDIAEFMGDKGNVVGIRAVPLTHREIVRYMRTRCPLNHVSVMFKKSAVMRAGGYRDWFWNEDYYLWIRMLEHGCRFGNTGTILVDVRVGADMYSRRGGWKYFKSELGLQNYMLKRKMIGFVTYALNVIKRFIVQCAMPNSMRSWVFRRFARNPAAKVDET